LVGILAGLGEDDLERGRLPLRDELALLAGDPEVVAQGALVGDLEGHRALRDGRLREREPELRRLAGYDRDRAAGLPVVPRECGHRNGEADHGGESGDEQTEPMSAHAKNTLPVVVRASSVPDRNASKRSAGGSEQDAFEALTPPQLSGTSNAPLRL